MFAASKDLLKARNQKEDEKRMKLIMGVCSLKRSIKGKKSKERRKKRIRLVMRIKGKKSTTERCEKE